MKRYFLVFTLFFLLVMPLFVFAQNNNSQSDNIPSNTQSDRIACPAGSTTCLTNPLGAAMDSPQKLIGKVITAVLGVVGSLALLIFVYGGLIWMTSSGSAEKIKQGRDTLLWAAIGLVVIFSAYGLTRVVLSSVMSN